MESINAKKTQKRPSSSSNYHTDEHNIQTAHDANQERPVGRKAAKKTLEMETSFIGLVAKLTKETEAKNRFLKEATSKRMMARNMEGMTPVQRRYYELKQAQILEDLQKEMDARE
ncbi:hypothetical protein F444_05243 [Phytophthora nicotianae P1976]|uniref:No apical meristem-associated C-terminal domain-containing protein n=1 Tax=Phytophthora nicotianae P1976 TaxID=1317066 RepID=A0A081AMT9_PHYNI|nr:hypothetical protein F444_05243 [Phytophthora nicotianae P1976]